MSNPITVLTEDDHHSALLKSVRLCLNRYRYAHIGHVALGHFADVGQCAAAVFLRVLHIRNHRRAAVGRHTPTEVFLEAAAERHLSQVRINNILYRNVIYYYIITYLLRRAPIVYRGTTLKQSTFRYIIPRQQY